MKAIDVAGVIAGEATSGTPEERFNDMLHIASVIKNRADMLGVTPEDVIAADNQFDAYNRSLPPGVDANIVDMAAKAWEQVNTVGPVTDATFYATPSAVDSLPSGLEPASSTTGHQYFTDPLNRSIRTTQGYQRPNPGLLSTVQDLASNAQNIATDGFGNAVGSISDLLDRGTNTFGQATSGLLDGVQSAVASVPGTAKSVPDGYDPANDLGLGPANLPNVSFQMGPGRPFKPDQAVVDVGQLAADSILGPGSTVTITSGKDDAVQTGSNRHGTGLAADFTFTDPSGHTLSWRDPADLPALQDIAQAAAAIGGENTSIGLGYDHADHMMHIDTVPDLSAGQDREWGNVGNPMAGILADARANGTMPASYWDRVAAHVTDAGIVPSLLDRTSMQINQPTGMMAAVNPPMDTTVTRAALPDVSSAPVNGWQEMAAANQTPAAQAIQSQISAPYANAYQSDMPAEIRPGIQAMQAMPTVNAADFSQITTGIPQGTLYNGAMAEVQNPGLLTSAAPQMAMTSFTPTVPGPATSTVVNQPATQPVARTQTTATNPAPAQKQETGLLGKLGLSKEQVAGGLLGNMALGPIGGLLGALAGSYVAKNPGILGSFTNQPMTINNLGTGMTAMQGVYGPGAQRGNTFTANNGAKVTALGNGDVAYTNKYGVQEVHEADGTVYSKF